MTTRRKTGQTATPVLRPVRVQAASVWPLDVEPRRRALSSLQLCDEHLLVGRGRPGLVKSISAWSDRTTKRSGSSSSPLLARSRIVNVIASGLERSRRRPSGPGVSQGDTTLGLLNLRYAGPAVTHQLYLRVMNMGCRRAAPSGGLRRAVAAQQRGSNDLAPPRGRRRAERAVACTNCLTC